MLNGKMSGCAMHLSRAMHSEMAQAPYPGTMAPAPFANPVAQTQAQPTQQTGPQWGWEPLPGPR
jgi:hypothetical protein